MFVKVSSSVKFIKEKGSVVWLIENFYSAYIHSLECRSKWP
jgi:hypothetical protein